MRHLHRRVADDTGQIQPSVRFRIQSSLNLIAVQLAQNASRQPRSLEQGTRSRLSSRPIKGSRQDRRRLVARPPHMAGRIPSVSHITPALYPLIPKRATVSIVLSVMYDLPGVTSTNDPTVLKINQFTDTLIDYASPGHYLVEIFPCMKYIPSSMAPWKRKAEKEFADYSNVFRRMFSQVEDRIVRSLVFFFHSVHSSYMLTERRRRKAELCWDFDTRTGAEQVERVRSRLASCYDVVRPYPPTLTSLPHPPQRRRFRNRTSLLNPHLHFPAHLHHPRPPP